MAIAYIISAYKQPDQLVRLVDRLDCFDAYFVLHIDARSLPEFGCALTDLASRRNVAVLKSLTFRYRSIDHVTVSLNGLAYLLRNRIRFEHVILLTGQDYPIKPLWQIHQQPSEHNGRSFVDYYPVGGARMPPRYERWHFFIRGRHLEVPRPASRTTYRRRFPRGYRPYGGSGYWILSRQAVEFIVQFRKRHPLFMLYFRFVDVPDELFFQTVLMNSPLRDTVVNDDLRYIDWNRLEGPWPAVFGTEDVPSLAASPDLFARKFDIAVDPRVLDVIDAEFLAKAPPRAEGAQ